MTDTENQTALATLGLLERRLQQVEFLLSGTDKAESTLQRIVTQGPDGTITARLEQIEKRFNNLSSDSPVIYDLLKLYAAHPDLFQPSVSALPPTTLTTAELLTIVSSCATSYPTTASRLTSLEDLPIPSAESSCALIALKPGLERLRLLQDVHEKEVAELRLRSAAVLQRVYELGVLGGGECWTEWDGRMGDVEKGVRREEGNQDREAKANEVYQS